MSQLSVTNEEWTESILNNLRDNEKTTDDKGNILPKCVGLLRFCQEQYGDILGLDTQIIQAPTEDNLRATVLSTITIKRYSDNEIVKFTEVADTDVEQLGEKFKAHLCATAASRAQGRAIKKAMFLNCYTSEEMMGGGNSPEQSSEKSINSSLKLQTIANVAKRLKIDKDDLAKKFKITNWDKVPAKKTEQILTYLNEVDSKK